MAGLSLRDKVRSSDIRRELGVEPLLLRVESEVVWASDQDTSQAPNFKGFPGTSDWEETPSQTENPQNPSDSQVVFCHIFSRVRSRYILY